MMLAGERLVGVGWRGRSSAVSIASLRAGRQDVILVVSVATILALAVALVPLGPDGVAVRGMGVGLALIEAGSLLWIRRAPGWAMAAAIAAGVTLQAVYPFAGSWGGATIALSRLSRARPRRVSLWGLAAMVVLAPWNAVATGWAQVAIAIAAACVAWSWGEAGRVRELRRQDELRHAVAAERRRIARELHDVIAHNVSVMVVQATAAEDRFEDRPEQARDALRAISSSGRAALSDLRRMLAVVRPDAGEDGSAPVPGLGNLDRLATSLQAAGLAVSVREQGPDVRVPAGVDLSAYRIVQEALTNTLRHARADSAEVLVRYRPDAVELEVSDDGAVAPGHSGGGEGRGIIGMRERAKLLGGSLDAGPNPLGGFRVLARLPFEAGS